MYQNIEKHYIMNSGGGCMLDILELSNGMVLAISDEYVGLYKEVEDIFETGLEVHGFWLPRAVETATELKEDLIAAMEELKSISDNVMVIGTDGRQYTIDEKLNELQK